jgi:hypothetical protein
MYRPRKKLKKGSKARENRPAVLCQSLDRNRTSAALFEPIKSVPALASLPRPTAGHLAAAACLSVVIAGIYGVIAWGQFIGSEGFQGHLDFAKRLYDTGHPPVPHFLFHALTAALFATHLAPTLLFAGRSVVLGCYLLIAWVTFALFWSVFRNSAIGRPSVLFLAALSALLAQPITLAHGYALGYLWPEPYEIPTSTVLKPFALASFICTAWYISRRYKMDVRLVSLFALCTVAGSLSKPSFIICLLPASVLLLLYRFSRKSPVSFPELLAGLYLPAAVVLAWQFYETYSGSSSKDMYHDSIMWAPFKFMAGWTTGLVSKFLLSIAFPLVVTVLYWKRAYRDTMMQLAWLCFLAGAVYTYMIVERVHWASGNMVWSGYITAFTLFVASIVFWLRQIAFSPSHGWLFQGRVLLCGVVIALHVISGARMDWLYLTHYGCTLIFQTAKFACPS